MSAIEIDALLAQVACGAVAPKTAFTLLVLNGEEREHVARLMFYALGGNDATELDPHGRPRYVGTGKLVAEVEHAISEMNET